MFEALLEALVPNPEPTTINVLTPATACQIDQGHPCNQSDVLAFTDSQDRCWATYDACSSAGIGYSPTDIHPAINRL